MYLCAIRVSTILPNLLINHNACVIRRFQTTLKQSTLKFQIVRSSFDSSSFFRNLSNICRCAPQSHYHIHHHWQMRAILAPLPTCKIFHAQHSSAASERDEPILFLPLPESSCATNRIDRKRIKKGRGPKSPEMMFSQKLNPITGAVEWVVVKAPNETKLDTNKSDVINVKDDQGNVNNVRDGNEMASSIGRLGGGTEGGSEVASGQGLEGGSGDSLRMRVARSAQGNGSTEVEICGIKGGDDVARSDPMDAIVHSSYLDMLNDKWRNELYRLAIRKAIRPGDHVLDIGSGTGLLAMMACRSLQEKETKLALARGHLQVKTTEEAPVRHAPLVPTRDPGTGLVRSGDRRPRTGRVTTCESFPPMATLARQVVEANGMTPRVTVVGKRSDEMEVGRGKDLPEKADLLVSEILDSELLGEGLLPSLRHAQKALLKEGGRVLPRAATIHAQLVECPFLRQCHDVAGVEAELADGLRLGPPAGGRPAVHVSSRQWPVHAEALLRPEGRGLRALSPPFEVFHFDFKRPPRSGRMAECHVATREAGTVHGIVSWWVLQLDEEGALAYSTAPSWVQSASATSAAGHSQTRGWGAADRAGQTPFATSPGALGQSEDATSADAPEHHPDGEQTEVYPSVLPGNSSGALGEAEDATSAQTRVRVGSETEGRSEAATSAETGGTGLDAVSESEAATSAEGGAWPHWRDHWKQCVWFIPGCGRTVDGGQALTVRAHHDDVSVRYEVEMEQPQLKGSHSQGSKTPIGACSKESSEALNPAKTLELDKLAEDHAAGESEIRVPKETLIPGPTAGEEQRREEPMGGSQDLAVRPERVWALLNGERRRKLMAAVQQLVGPHARPRCMVADDSLQLPLLAASANQNAAITALLPGLGPAGKAALLAAARANGVLPRQHQQAQGGNEEWPSQRLRVLGKRAAEVTEVDLGEGKVDVVLAEPFYSVSEGMLPWAGLRFWYELRAIAPSLSPAVQVMPSKCILRAVVASLPDLWDSRRALADVAGFDHSSANESLGACGAHMGSGEPSSEDVRIGGPILPYAVWQCGGYEELSERFTLMTFDFSRAPTSLEAQVEVPISRRGVGHAVVLWVDWVLLEGAPPLVLSTGPAATGDEEPVLYKQGIQFLLHPIKVGVHQREGNEPRATTTHSTLHMRGRFDEATMKVSLDVSRSFGS